MRMTSRRSPRPRVPDRTPPPASPARWSRARLRRGRDVALDDRRQVGGPHAPVPHVVRHDAYVGALGTEPEAHRARDPDAALEPLVLDDRLQLLLQRGRAAVGARVLRGLPIVATD